jgi:hypothetical protein
MMVMGADPHRGQRGMRTSLVVSSLTLAFTGTRWRLRRRRPVVKAASGRRYLDGG